MKRRYVLRFVFLSLCLSLIGACQWMFEKQKPVLEPSHDKRLFCQFVFDVLSEHELNFKYCYVHPPVVKKMNMSWYWISEERLKYYLNQVNVIKVDEDIEEKQQLLPDVPVVYLTFDDGPGKYTDQVLHILKEENIKATFFVLGVQVEQHPKFTQQIVLDGHTIGNHSYDHHYKKLYGDFDEFTAQIIRTNELIYQLTSIKVDIFRAPGGSINNMDESYFAALKLVGMRVFDWNVDSKDSQVRGMTSEEMLEVIKETHLYNPAYVLLHDTNTSEQSMLALKSIIQYYKEQGYQFAAIDATTPPLTFKLGSNNKWGREVATTEQLEAFKQAYDSIYE